MNLRTGYPDHIEDYLVTVRTGGWFDWTDPYNKIYENLNVIDGCLLYTSPSPRDKRQYRMPSSA